MERYNFKMYVMLYGTPYYVYSYLVVCVYSCEFLTKQGNAGFLLLSVDTYE